ncbi:FUSC family protein [Massilia sp. S19_KUP03_FR1]|uniref:FUSC family protein n=1 Tax=Massilia sp. S19_KUP03_FR1 TaxID=3025503 RepID=UPI002FCDB378
MTNPVALRRHVAQVLQWSGAARVERSLMLVSFLAVAVPIAAAVLLKRPDSGTIVALGAVLLAPEPTPGSASDDGTILGALLPAGAAMAAASVLARLPDADVLMIALITGAAALVNYSRPAALAGLRFIVVLVLTLALIGPHAVHGGAALLFGSGVLWRTALQLLGRYWQTDPVPVPVPVPATAARRVPTPRQRRAHLRRQLKTLQGWQYPLRLAAGLAAACAVRAIWPQHHVDWLVLVIVLMTPRTIEHLPVAVTQRVLGTLVGVGLAGAVVYAGLPYAALLMLLCLCGTLAPVARRGNYAAWCALSTPLILLAMDAHGPIGAGMLADRVAATMLGGLLIASANLAMDGLLRLAPAR